jgi:hypothetical protein
MILYNAVDIRGGTDVVIEIRHGSDVVWSGETDFGGIWVFDDPSPNDTIKMTATFPGRSSVDWGDGISEGLTSDTSITHTY